MQDFKENSIVNAADARMVLSSGKDIGFKEIRVDKEVIAVQDTKTASARKAGDIIMGLGSCEDLNFKEIGPSNETVEMQGSKIAWAKHVETEAKGRIMILGKDPLLEDCRYEDDQCSVVTCEIENFPASPSADGETLELSSGQNVDYLAFDCQTPKESIFDPFASGPEELVFAPKKKMPNGTRLPLWRKLNYDLFDDSFESAKGNICEDSVEDCLVDFISKSLLELILTTEVQKIHDVNPDYPVEHQLHECLKTPASLPLLTGIAETCPPAPLRPAGRSKLLSKGICRKLDFGTDAV